MTPEFREITFACFLRYKKKRILEYKLSQYCIIRSEYITYRRVSIRTLYRVYQNDWSDFEVDYIHKYGEQNCRPRTWPARSPDLTPCDYFLWGYVKNKVFVPPQPVSIPDLKNRITAAVETITPDLLSRVWQELNYRLDVCRVTKGAYIEHL